MIKGVDAVRIWFLSPNFELDNINIIELNERVAKLNQ